MYWLLIILLVLAIYFIFFISQFYNIFFNGYAPFISTDRKTIKEILNQVKLKEAPIVYELGCGRARFLTVMGKFYPSAKLTGVENLFSLYAINKIRFKLQGSKIKILRTDFFKVNLAEADLIYCYLNNATMLELGKKFKQECRQGTQIVSRSFPIPQLNQEKVIVVKDKKIYFYKI